MAKRLVTEKCRNGFARDEVENVSSLIKNGQRGTSTPPGSRSPRPTVVPNLIRFFRNWSSLDRELEPRLSEKDRRFFLLDIPSVCLPVFRANPNTSRRRGHRWYLTRLRTQLTICGFSRQSDRELQE